MTVPQRSEISEGLINYPVDENCVLLGNYAASSSSNSSSSRSSSNGGGSSSSRNFLPTFRDNLSVSYAGLVVPKLR